ncbi:hypothetical protein [Nocardiopsis tropica]|uniref:Uncharacterized protein n=1 Tax=Nocardiopsis tropica TaxID=109330 RepID=A0ABV1ZZA2_9ACTN
MALQELMEVLGGLGVTVIFKSDHERLALGEEPWTLVFSGPGLGEDSFIRVDGASLRECMEFALGELGQIEGIGSLPSHLNSENIFGKEI